VQLLPDGGFFAMDGARMLVSTDGISWTGEPGPAGLSGYRTVGYVTGSDLWATAEHQPRGTGADRLFHRDGSGEWVETTLDVPSIVAIRGVDWIPLSLHPVGAVDGTTLVVGRMLTRIPWEDRYGLVTPDRGSLETSLVPEVPIGVYDTRTGTITIYNPIDGGVMASVGVDVAAGAAKTTISYFDQASGDLLLEVGVPEGNESLVESLSRGLPAEQDVLWSGGHDGPFEAHIPPWTAPGATPIIITAVDGRFVAMVDLDGAVTVWTSDNGRDWVKEPVPPFFATAISVDLVESNDGLIANVVSDAPGGIDLSTWVSMDGVTWSQAREAMPSGDVYASGFGFVHIRENIIERGRWVDLVRELRVSSDGELWEKVELPWGANFAFLSTSVVDRTLFLILDDGYRRIMWVGRVV